jgi:hypothetical protein
MFENKIIQNSFPLIPFFLLKIAIKWFAMKNFVPSGQFWSHKIRETMFHQIYQKWLPGFPVRS